MERHNYMGLKDEPLRMLVRQRLEGGFPFVYDTGRGKVAAFKFKGESYHFVRSEERDIMLDILAEVPAKDEELKHLDV